MAYTRQFSRIFLFLYLTNLTGCAYAPQKGDCVSERKLFQTGRTYKVGSVNSDGKVTATFEDNKVGYLVEQPFLGWKKVDCKGLQLEENLHYQPIPADGTVIDPDSEKYPHLIPKR